MTPGVTTRRSLVSKTLAMALMVMLVGAWLAPVAHAQIAGIGDPVGVVVPEPPPLLPPEPPPPPMPPSDGLVGDIGGGSTGTGSGSGGDPIGGVIDTIDNAKDQAEETAGDAGGNIGQVAPGAGGVIDSVKEKLDRTPDGLSGTGGHKKKGARSSNGRTDSRSPSSVGTGTEVLGGSLADALRADGKIVAAATQVGTDYAVTGASVTGQSVITQIGRVAAEAAQQAAFPIALILMVVAFLMVQNRIDGKDPKLALAPVDSEHDLLSFT